MLYHVTGYVKINVPISYTETSLVHEHIMMVISLKCFKRTLGKLKIRILLGLEFWSYLAMTLFNLTLELLIIKWEHIIGRFNFL
jgi:hypothetical protein